jgi:hypothetical protein
MRQRYDNLGASGLNSDVQPSLLPPGAWTTLSDVATENGALRSVYGETRLVSLPCRPVYHTSFRDTYGAWLLVVSDGASVWKVAIATGIATDVTPTGVVLTAMNPAGYISFANLNGVLVVNSSTDGPFYLPPSGVLLPLPGWTVTWRCREMAAYRYFLVALNMTEGGNPYPHKLRWSNSAEEGKLPTEWIAAPENDAGDDLLGETLGHIVGGVIVRDALTVVKEDAAYSMTWVGGTSIMRVDRLIGASGTSIQRGYVEAQGSLVTCASRDLVKFDGAAAQSIAQGKVRRALESLASDAGWAQTKLFRHQGSTTLWVGGVGASGSRLTSALVFDWSTGAWWKKTLSNGYGFDALRLSDQGEPLSEILIYESNPADTSWWASRLEGDANTDGTAKTCEAQRVGLPIEGADGMAMVREAWLEMDGTALVEVTFGGQSGPAAPVVWGASETWLPGTTRNLTPRVSGRYLAVKLRSQSTGWWRLGALTVDWARGGER